MLDLSIIIVNFNAKKVMLDCLNSIKKYSKGLKFEIIFVDNNSTDGGVEEVKKIKGLPIKIIKNKENLGFGKGNNVGMKSARGRYVLLLNTDTLFHDNFLPDMIKWMDEHPKVGVSSCALKNSDGSLQGTGGYFPTLWKVFAWMFFLEDLPVVDRLIKPFHPMHPASPFYKGEQLFREPIERDWLTGAFMVIRKKVIDSIGFFDDDYFMYMEEVDYCFKAKKMGWKIWYLPEWKITHLGGASGSTERTVSGEFDSLKIFYKKNMPSWQYPLMLFIVKIGIILRIIIFLPIKGLETSKIYAKAL